MFTYRKMIYGGGNGERGCITLKSKDTGKIEKDKSGWIIYGLGWLVRRSEMHS